MIFIINDLKYDISKMEKIGKVKKWYKCPNLVSRMFFPENEEGYIFECELYKSQKGNHLLVYERYNKTVHAEAISEKEAKDLLKQYDYENYVKIYGEIKEA